MHLVMFDIDGTLVDSTGFDSRLYAQAIREIMAVPFSTRWEKYQHVTDAGILQEIIHDHSMQSEQHQIAEQVAARFSELVRSYIDENGATLTEIPGARVFLRRLAADPNVRLAFATGGWEETARMKLEATDISLTGIPIATANDAMSRTQIMKIAEKRAASRLPFSSKIYFGDRAWDKKAAEELGYQFWAIGDQVRHNVRYQDYREIAFPLDFAGLQTKI